MGTLESLRELQSIAQAGLTYSHDPYDLERFERLLRLTAELLADATGQDALAVHGALQVERDYLTPKVDVRALVLDDRGRVLLTRERADGLWSLPGGWADPGESPREMAVREVREETGREVRAARLLMVLDKFKHPHPPDVWAVYKLFIHCELLGDVQAHPDNVETLESGWFPLTDLPPLSLGRNLPQQVQRAAELALNPALGVDVD